MEYDLNELLGYIDPAALDYNEWLGVGMALKQEGCPLSDWEAWSAKDPRRFHRDECRRKWETFGGSQSPVTAGTIFHMAKGRGWQPREGGGALEWTDTIRRDRPPAFIDQEWVEEKSFMEPDEWDPAGQLIRYIETVFEAGECVGYLMQSRRDDKGKYRPGGSGNFARTADELVTRLKQCRGDIGSVLGDYDPEGGAWIRFNPLDGKGIKNENVTDYRYALIESDDMALERQNALLRELELPIAALIYSGNKSLHAVVRVDAADYEEYKARVNYLYKVCQGNGLNIDTQNRNPSRMTRMPGVRRGSKKQYLIDTNIGRKDWNEWFEWVEAVNDDLPDMEGLAEKWGDMPPLAPELIKGVLREGHKMLLAGPSKAGKSFLLIELAIAIAEGSSWLGWGCSRGKVIYVNLELDHASCLHRFRDAYYALGYGEEQPPNADNVVIWNLRGKAIPMDKLAPRLIRRARKVGCKAIIIDPIYKVITGDENSADQMARFCNQFDKVCAELGCAVIYCHHHSKGAQGQKKASDRASGSGVFARDPDAMLDMIELTRTEALLEQEDNKAACAAVRRFLENETWSSWDWKGEIGQDDWLNARTLLSLCENRLAGIQMGRVRECVEKAKAAARQRTAWRIEGTLREFPSFDPVNLWFKYPVHLPDESGVLQDLGPEEEANPFRKMAEKKKKQAEANMDRMLDQLAIAYEAAEVEGKAKLQDISEALGIDQKKLGLWLGNGKQSRKELKKYFRAFTREEDHMRYVERVHDE